MQPSTHPADDTLRAYLDGELDWAAATRCALHLRRCARCEAGLDEIRRLDQHAARLIGPVAAGASGPPRARRWAAAGAAGVVVLTLLYLGRPPRHDAALAAGVRDVCCWDLDGGGRGDDGVFTRSRDGEVVECAIVYDDVDRSRSLTPADVVRSTPTADACVAPPGVRLPTLPTSPS